MHYVCSAYRESKSILSLTCILSKFEVIDKGYGIILKKGKHYNNITSFVPYKNIIMYSQSKIFINLNISINGGVNQKWNDKEVYWIYFTNDKLKKGMIQSTLGERNTTKSCMLRSGRMNHS
jgi:hypothetical protein